MKDLEGFYRKHRKEVEQDGKKSKEFTFGRAGMRTGNKKLSVTKGVKWAEVVCKIKALFTDTWAQYVRVKETANKDALKGLPAEQLEALGLTVKQREEFWIETYPEKAVEVAA